MKPLLRLSLPLRSAIIAVSAVLSIAPAHSEDEPGPGVRGQVMSSAPTIAAPNESVAPQSSGPVVARPTGGLEAEPPGQLAYLIPREQQPWILRYREPNPAPTLYLSLPTEQEVRLMLPGAALDAAARVRQAVGKYITDAIGVAAQDRARALDGLKAWREQVGKAEQDLPSNEVWAKYAFSLEVRSQVAAYRELYVKSAGVSLARLGDEAPRAIAQITPIMNAAQDFEQRTAWFNVMVQLRDGVQLYQSQALSGDAQVLQLIADFEAAHPPVPRPAGAVPQTRTAGPSALARPRPSDEPSAPQLGAAEARQPAAPPPAPADEGSGFLGFIILSAMAAAVVFFFMRLRKKVQIAPPA